MRTRLLRLAALACAVPSALVLTHEVAVADHGAYRARIVTAPAVVAPGSQARVSVAIHAPSGEKVRRFDDLHTMSMHLIAVSQDLTEFAHVHPAPSPSGTLTTALRFRKAQPYTIFMEYDPAGAAGQQLTRAALRPVGSRLVPAKLDAAAAFDGTASRDIVLGNTRVKLVGHAGRRARAGVATKLHASIRDASGGPANIGTYLEMPGHAIVISENLATFLHLHATALASGTGIVGGMDHASGHGSGGGHGGHGTPTAGDDLAFDVTFPRQGLYKVWIQFQRGGAVVTAPFIVKVS